MIIKTLEERESRIRELEEKINNDLRHTNLNTEKLEELVSRNITEILNQGEAKCVPTEEVIDVSLIEETGEEEIPEDEIRTKTLYSQRTYDFKSQTEKTEHPTLWKQ